MTSMRAGQVLKITWEKELAQPSFSFYLHVPLKRQESNTALYLGPCSDLLLQADNLGAVTTHLHQLQRQQVV